MEGFMEILQREMDKRRKSRGLSNKTRIRGRVIAEVFGADGKLKQRSVMHNIVTDEGDAAIVDMLATTGTQTAFNNANAYIEVGTGYAGGAKAQASCATPTGSPEAMDATYPMQKGAFGAANDNVLVFKSTFEAGDLNDTGIDEAAILNNVTAGSADALAYAEITPAVNVGASDTLAITWEITFLGA